MTATATRPAGNADATRSGKEVENKSTIGITALAVILSGLFFFVDFLVPLGVAAGVPYIAVVLLGIWLLRPQHVVGLAIAASLLTVLGFLLSPMGGIPWMVLANRALA